VHTVSLRGDEAGKVVPVAKQYTRLAYFAQ
jgi:hypothetical protein